jgi:glycosyltransferase involved in cell wall biosynthesis
MNSQPTLDLSVILPVYDEEGNLAALHRELTHALDPLGRSYEIIAIDDGSRDGTWDELVRLTGEDPHMRIVQFRRNFGQSAAFSAGIDMVRGAVVVTMDADGQNDPADIPALLAELERGDYDLVGGWRQNRKEPFLTRRLPSMIANALIGRASRVPLHDRGCSLRAYRYDLIKQIKLYGEMHRFIPELASQVGARMSEVPVNDRARRFGRSKYNLSRVPRVLLDLLTVTFLDRYRTRPMQCFGLMGLASGGIGFLVGSYLLISTIAIGIWQNTQEFRAYRASTGPWWMLVILLIVLGIQFFVMGLLGELLTRVYHESQGKSIYAIRQIIERPRTDL